MGQFSNSFPKHFSYLCEYAFIGDLSCSFCEYPIIFHCLHCSPSCFDPDSLLLAHFWLGLSWIDSISANKRFSSSKTSSRKPYVRFSCNLYSRFFQCKNLIYVHPQKTTIPALFWTVLVSVDEEFL